jgi:hypothetical protein
VHAPPSGAHVLQLALQQNSPLPHTAVPHVTGVGEKKLHVP